MKNYKILGAASALLGLIACSDSATPIKLKGGAALQLADGSPISQASTDEYNPYVVKMSDGYLMLVFGSDRSCGGCTAGTHNIFVARSVSAYNNRLVLPAFNTPVVFTLAGTPLNQSSAIAFAASSSNFGLRIFFNHSSGSIRYADLSPTGGTFNASNGGSNITNSAWAGTIIIGISANGQQLITKSATAVYIVDPFGVNPTLTAMSSISAATQSMANIDPSYAGIPDAYFALMNGNFVAASHANGGPSIGALNSPATAAKVTMKAASIFQSGSQGSDLILMSGVESGASKQDLFAFEGASPVNAWLDLKSKPNSTGIPAGGVGGSISTTATRVYGQGGLFSSANLNNGGLSSVSFNRPIHVMLFDGGLYVADQINNRGLFFAGISTTATRVYCQNGSFAAANFNVAPSTVQCRGEAPNGNVSGIFADFTGVYVVDIGSHRVPFHLGATIDASTGRIYGQNGSFTTFSINNPSVATGGLNNPDRVYTDTAGVYIADTGNNRVLFFADTSTTTPSRVYGQNGSFSTTTAGSGANGLSAPRGISGDGEGIYIVDTGNHRVLYYAGTSTTATRVYGQLGSFTSNTANNGGPSANSLNQPWMVRPYAGGVFIADDQNNRVLYYASTSTTASQVWGQYGSFTCNVANNNGGCGGPAVSANSLNNPTGIDVDTTGLYIADKTNHRVLFFPRQ
jgi:hypothetical protein